MTPYIHTYYVNIANGADYRRERHPLTAGDKNADQFVVVMQKCGGAVDLTGAAVTGKVIRPDGKTVPLEGDVVNGAACITLDGDCYAIPGEIKLTITLSAGDIIQTVLVVMMDVQTSETSVVVDNGVIGSLTELLAEIANMREAAEDALAAANDARAAAVESEERTDAALTSLSSAFAGAAPAIVPELSGGLLTPTDAAARPVQALVSRIRPLQEGTGTPAPDNVRPLTGWDVATVTRTARNLVSHLDYVFALGNTATVVTEDVIDITSPSVNDTGDIKGIHLKAGVTYTLVIDWEVYGRDEGSTLETVAAYRLAAHDNKLYLKRADSNKTYRITFVYNPEEDVIAEIDWLPNYGNTSGPGATSGQLRACSRSRIMLLEGAYTADTAPAFVPCTRQAITTALPETVYGGTLDWTTGLLTVTHDLMEITAFDVQYTSVAEGLICGQLRNQAQMRSGSGANGWCDQLPAAASIMNAAAPCVSFGGSGNNSIYAAFPTSIAGSTLEELNAYVAANPLHVVYPLAEPRTIQLDTQTLDMLRGYNAVWSDVGDTDIAYIADTKMYIDNAVAAIAAAIINQ